MKNNIIELRDVHTAFNGQRVHSGINLCIKEGEVMSLIGSSGVGKSVLLKELIGILKPDKGEILVMGRNIVPLKEEELIKILDNLAQATEDLKTVTGTIAEGEGSIGAIINDPTLYDNLIQLLGGANRSFILRTMIRHSMKNAVSEEVK